MLAPTHKSSNKNFPSTRLTNSKKRKKKYLLNSISRNRGKVKKLLNSEDLIEINLKNILILKGVEGRESFKDVVGFKERDRERGKLGFWCVL